MKKYIHLIDTDFTKESYNLSADIFERLAVEEKGNWLPYYYASFANIVLGTMLNDPVEKDLLFRKGMSMAEKAASVSTANSEVYALQAFALQMYISVYPYSRGISNYARVNDLLSKAIELNSDNPRAYYLKASGYYYTPSFLGGGKEKAIATFKLAEQKFNASNFDILLPHWGTEWNKSMMLKSSQL